MTECVYSVGDNKVELSDTLFCSRATPTIALRRLTVRTSRPCRLEIRARIDADCAPGEALSSGSPVHEADSLLHWQTEGGLSSCGLALATTISTGTEVSRRPFERMSTLIDVNADGEAVEVTQIAAIVPSILHEEPHWQALRLLRSAMWRGVDAIAAETKPCGARSGNPASSSAGPGRSGNASLMLPTSSLLQRSPRGSVQHRAVRALGFWVRRAHLLGYRDLYVSCISACGP